MESKGEELLRLFNSNYFLKEFTFRKKEVDSNEFTDGFIWLRDYLLIWEHKERNPKIATCWPPSKESQRRWFKNKVLRIAKDQIKEDKEFFDKIINTKFANLRAQKIELSFDTVKEKHYLIIYDPRHPIPSDCLAQKHYRTKSKTFIHLIHVYNWAWICKYLQTPMETIEYLSFRKRFLTYYPDARNKSEKWLLGRFLASPNVPDPDYDNFQEDYEKWVDDLENKDETLRKFDFILKNLYEKIDTKRMTTEEYFKLLLELALLDRVERETFIERFDITLKQACDEYCTPNRVVFHRDSGEVAFAFCPLPRNESKERQAEWLKAFMQICKYDLKVDKCFGICIRAESDRGFWIEWGLISDIWKFDKRMEVIVEKARNDGVLSKMKGPQKIKRYKFRNEIQ
ncbi:hypothetical protein JXM67_08005 [candidate division WOR-3 bacterium]|nr:hypothetical protein [candidate division WOR-3 bacterium]